MRRAITVLTALCLSCGPVVETDADLDGHPAGADCDDADPAINPGASEGCDGVDNDCDGEVDEPGPADPAWHLDEDGDGFGHPHATQTACAPGEGLVADASDCDDSDPEVHPEAVERCNDVDDDCDGQIDGPGAVDAPAWFADGDGDGFGAAEEIAVACDPPPGASANADDCDDAAPEVFPGAEERCDGVDGDCDGEAEALESLGATPECAQPSCGAVLAAWPAAPDGLYWLDAGLGPFEAECDQGADGGGWMLVGAVDAVAGCPGDWVVVSGEGVCAPAPALGGSASVGFATRDVAWRDVRVAATLRGRGVLDAFHVGEDLDGPYVDGLSLTVEDTGEHLFTFAVGGPADAAGPNRSCPADGGDPAPEAVADAWRCASGSAVALPPMSWSPWLLFDADPVIAAAADETTSDVRVRLVVDGADGESVGVAALSAWVR